MPKLLTDVQRSALSRVTSNVATRQEAQLVECAIANWLLQWDDEERAHREREAGNE